MANPASRIENYNRVAGTRLLISQETYELVKADVRVGKALSAPSHPTGSAGGLGEVPPMPSGFGCTRGAPGGMRRGTYGKGPVRTA